MRKIEVEAVGCQENPWERLKVVRAELSAPENSPDQLWRGMGVEPLEISSKFQNESEAGTLLFD